MLENSGDTRLENGALYQVIEGADNRQTKTIPVVRVKGDSVDFKMGVALEFDTPPTQLSDLDTTDEISSAGWYHSNSLQQVDYLGYTGNNSIVVVKGVLLKKISE
jgi:hypothetical protein